MTEDKGKPKVVHTVKVEKYRSQEDADDPTVDPYDVSEAEATFDLDGNPIEKD